MKKLLYAVLIFLVARLILFVITNRGVQSMFESFWSIRTVLLILSVLVGILVLILFVGIPVFAWMENKKNGLGYGRNLERLMSSED